MCLPGRDKSCPCIEKTEFSAKAPQRKKIFNSAVDSEKNGENGRYLKKYGDI
jgi:hypothetical protein